jgi:hypothetical protein
MIRIQALRYYRREFLHALRNGADAEDAADQAYDRTKKEVNTILSKEIVGELERQQQWGDIMDVLVEWQILLVGLPIDINKCPAKPHLDEELSPQLPKPLVE